MRIIKQPIALFFFFILATIPFFFGALPPLIQGGYTSLILVVCGTWLVFHFEEVKPSIIDKTYFPYYLFIAFVFFTAIPLLLILLKLLSPLRADYIASASSLNLLNNINSSISYHSSSTCLYGVFLLGLLLFYLFTVNVTFRDTDKISILWICMIVGSIEAVYGIVQVMIPSLGTLWLPSDLSSVGYARGTILNKHQFAGFLNLCWPMTFALGISLYHPVISRFKAMKNRQDVTAKDRLSLMFQKNAIPFWSTALMMLAIVFSGSRAGIFVMLLLTALFLRILPFAKRIRAMVIGSFILFFILYGSLQGFQKITNSFLLTLEITQDRFALWQKSFLLLKDNLFTGSGMGTYTLLSPFYFEKVPNQLWLDALHNEYLELAFEIGLPISLFIILWVFWNVLRSGSSVIKTGRKIDTFTFYPEQLIIAIGSYFAIIGFLIHGTVDTIWRLPANALFAVALVSLLKIALSDGIFHEK